MLGGCVRPGEGRPRLARGAGHDGDGAAAVGDEVRDDDPGEVDDGEHVQLEHVLVNLEGLKPDVRPHFLKLILPFSQFNKAPYISQGCASYFLSELPLSSSSFFLRIFELVQFTIHSLQ